MGQLASRLRNAPKLRRGSARVCGECAGTRCAARGGGGGGSRPP